MAPRLPLIEWLPAILQRLGTGWSTSELLLDRETLVYYNSARKIEYK
jgi:hypothetical protein